MKRLLKKVLATIVALTVGVTGASAQASFNFTYTEGVAPAAGGDYFLYNIGTGQFLTNGLNYGTRATVDNSGRVLTLAANGSGYSIYTNYVSLNNRTEAKAGYLTTNGYVDTGSNDAAWIFTPVSVNGYTNAYTIKNSDTQYLFFDKDNTNPGCPVNVGNNTNNNYSYWLLIPKLQRENEGDYTHYLINTQMNACWEWKTWNGITGWNDNSGIVPGGLVSNRCAEKYHTKKDIYQDIKEYSSLPEGRYKLCAQGFWRQDGSDAGAVLYINDDKATLAGYNANNEGTNATMDGASTSFTAGLYENAVETFLNNGSSMKVGINITSDSQWVIFDNFVLKYLGKCVMDYAVALPENNMTADTWYYFDIPVAGDYTLTTTNLNNIKFTTDGYTLISTTPSDSWNNSSQTLDAGRYYVKSSSAQTLEIAPANYSYNVGSAVIDHTYIQPGQTVTITYSNAVTNSGENLTINTNNITFDGSTISATATSNGFTFIVPEALSTSTDYTLSIPAGAIGYTQGNTFNEAESFTLKTPALFDGIYYLKVAGTTTDLSSVSTETETVGMYLSRGAAWGTHATIDDYGLALTITTDVNNNSVLQVYDTKRYYFRTGSYDLYADGTGGTADNQKFRFSAMNGRLLISDNEHSTVYWKHNNKNLWPENQMPSIYFDGTGTNSGPIILWEAETPAAHQAILNSYRDAQAVQAAQNAVSGNGSVYGALATVSSVADMESAVENLPFSGVILGGEEPTSVQEKYQGNQPNPAPETVYSATLTIPEPGLYKFSMQAFYRAASNPVTQNMHTNGVDCPPVVLFLGDSQTQIKSLYDEEGGSSPYVSGNDAEYNGKYYANNMDGALKMFQEGKYNNDVWAYFPEAGEYSYGVKYLGHANANMQWFIYSPEAVTVRYYGAGTIRSENGIVTVLGQNALADINAALTTDISVLNIKQATGLSNANITTTNNPNLLIYANTTSQVSNSANVIVGGTCKNLVLSKQNAPFFVPEAFTAATAKYTVAPRDLAGGEYATLMIPFAGNVPTGKAYTLDQGVSTLGGEINATEVSTVPANSPVLVTGSGQFSASNASIPAFDRGATYASGELVGVYQLTQAPVGSYVLQNHTNSPNGVAFYLVNDVQPNVGTFRAYVKSQSGNVKQFRVNFGGESTEIATIDAEGKMSLEGAEYFTVGGARLNAPQKGVNIVKFDNGSIKKIIIK